jgi:hypothetical protein
MTDVETLRSRLSRDPLDVAPSVYNASIGTNGLLVPGQRYYTHVQVAANRPGFRR